LCQYIGLGEVCQEAGGERNYSVTVNVTNKHPFAQLLLNATKGAAFNASLFPAIVVATETDEKPDDTPKD